MNLDNLSHEWARAPLPLRSIVRLPTAALGMLLAIALPACLASEAADKVVEAPPAPLIVVPGLEEPLVAMHSTSPTEDQLIHRAVAEYKRLGASGASAAAVLVPLERFVASNPASPWTPAVQTDLGLAYYAMGRFSLAFQSWQAAWDNGRTATVPEASALIDRAVGELARMHARVGHADELERLFKDIRDRPLRGPATELITGAHEGAWEMRHDPGEAYLCGPKALGNVFEALHGSLRTLERVDTVRSGPHGFTLNQVSQLAKDAGLDHRLIRRRPGQAIPVPSIIHWKVNHYAAVVSESNGRYHLQDPTFGGDLEVSRDVIDSESSGYFLVPLGMPEDPRWQDAASEETQAVFGMGKTTGSQPGATTGDDTKTSSGCPPDNFGMCAPDAHAMNVSLNLTDTPIGYQPQKGPSAFIQLTYNQREATQPANFTYMNVGPKWTVSILSFVEDSPAASAGTGVSRYLAGGGRRSYGGYSTSTGAFSPEKQTGAVLTRTPLTGTATSYTLTMPDGTRLTYGKSDGATTGTRRMFLGSIVDPQGTRLSFGYDSSLLRVNSMQDAAGRLTTFSYDPTRPLRMTSITDPFGRVATLSYNVEGQLSMIEDMAGFDSLFTYDANGLITRLETPYGVTSFAFGGTKDANGADLSRWLEITDPLGATERVEYMHDAPGIMATDPVVPAGMGLTNNMMQYRNTFYWDKNVYPTYGTGPTKDYTKAKRWHWLHASSTITSPILESIKEPNENRVWFRYAGQSSSLFEGTNGFVTMMGRVLDDGSTQLWQASYNSVGRPLTITDPSGRQTQYTYPNNADLTKVEQRVYGTTSTYQTLRSLTYDSNHNIQSVTEASGATWNYTYNTAGQLLTVKDPNGVTVLTNNYEPLRGRLISRVNANGFNAVTYTYPTDCETSNPTHLNCDQPVAITDSEGYRIGYDRDGLDRIKTITYPDLTHDLFSYSLLDMTARTDRLGRSTTFTYDKNRRLTQITKPSNETFQYAYYANGALKTAKDPKGNVTTWSIDLQGRPTAITYANGTTTQYGYETTNSRLKAVTDALGEIKNIAHNLDNSVLSVTYDNDQGSTPDVSFTYDSTYPRRSQMFSQYDGATWTYQVPGSYGALSLLSEDPSLSFDSVTYGYDSYGRVKSLQVEGVPLAEQWTYDVLGRVSRHVTNLGTFDYTYLGQTSLPLTRTLSGTNIKTTWAYDTNQRDRRLIGVTNSNGARDFTFTYDRFSGATGQDPYRVQSASQSGTSFIPGRTLCYSYDASGRLTEAATKTGTGNCSQRTALWSYLFDPASNITRATAPGGTTNFTYNNLNQIASMTNGSSSTPVAFDAAGRLTTLGTMTRKWDAEGRLVESKNGSNTLTFRYDGLGRWKNSILSTPSGTITSHLVWCGSSICGKRLWNYQPSKRYFPEGEYDVVSAAKWVTTKDGSPNTRVGVKSARPSRA